LPKNIAATKWKKRYGIETNSLSKKKFQKHFNYKKNGHEEHKMMKFYIQHWTEYETRNRQEKVLTEKLRLIKQQEISLRDQRKDAISKSAESLKFIVKADNLELHPDDIKSVLDTENDMKLREMEKKLDNLNSKLLR
jgi:hypothetical protein